jgi:hypothetical protein
MSFFALQVLLSNVWLTGAALVQQASAARPVSNKPTLAKKNSSNSHLDAPELDRSARRSRNKNDRAFVYVINFIDCINPFKNSLFLKKLFLAYAIVYCFISYIRIQSCPAAAALATSR